MDWLANTQLAQPAPMTKAHTPNQTQTVPTGSLLHELSTFTSTSVILSPQVEPSPFHCPLDHLAPTVQMTLAHVPNQTQPVPMGSLLHELPDFIKAADIVLLPQDGRPSTAQMTAHVPNQTHTVPEGSLLHELPNIIRAADDVLLPQRTPLLELPG